MEELLKAIDALKQSEVRGLIDARIREFRELGEASSSEIFKELCFCILTANFSAERGIRIQKEIEDGFLTLPEAELTKKLRDLGHRYPEARAKYIVEARHYSESLKDILRSFRSERALREWLAENVKGLGLKEASHFLRNVGYTDLAILDFHIIELLAKRNLVEKTKTLTKKRYLKIEDLLKEIARSSNLSLAELDLYLWYMETGKVLK
jgi:N-glycosylase/DNA lyase